MLHQGDLLVIPNRVELTNVKSIEVDSARVRIVEALDNAHD